LLRISNPSANRLRAFGLALACALVAACGDDATDGLSSCPGGRIELGKNNVFGCAPMSRAGTAGAKSGAAGAKSASTPQANTGTKPAAAGAPASSGAANGGVAGAMPAAMSGEAGAPSSQASNPPPASSGTPAAMSGSGSGKAPEIPSGPWSCLQVNDVCSCVPSAGLGDSCTKPRPTCCTFVTMNGKAVACVCAPEGSAQCTGMKADSSTYPSVAKCPP
jgi:hypothetical protein